jgi:hypothetical protein
VGSIPASRTIKSTFPQGKCFKHKKKRAKAMNWDAWFQTVTYASYRVSSYVLMNLGEDAALVAFMFC